MPQVTAQLVRKCLRLDSGGHPRNFDEIADALLAEYQDLFGEEADLEAPDADILRADSHNNRAVSLLDVAREAEASGLLAEALKDNPFHLEAIYNKAMLQARSSGQSVMPMISALTQMSTHPAHKWRRARLVAWAWAHGIEVTEAMPHGYLRHKEFKDEERNCNPELDSVDPPLSDPWRTLRSNLLKKAAKNYLPRTSLLVYFNIGIFSFKNWNVPVLLQLLDEHLRLPFEGLSQFEEVMILDAGMTSLARIHPSVEMLYQKP